MTSDPTDGDIAADGTRAPYDPGIAVLLAPPCDEDEDDLVVGPTLPGVMLIDPDTLACELDPPGFLFEDDDGTSREDVQRRAFLRRHAQRPGGLFRRHLIADRAMVVRLEELADTTPNGCKGVEVVLRAASLSLHAGMPLRSPPLLLLGPPGTGKTRLAAGLARALGTSMRVIDGSLTSDPGPFTGNHASWRGSGPSRVAKALLDGSTAALLILIDEIDKISAYNATIEPRAALLGLFEPSAAATFVDNYLELQLRADGVVWVATANAIEGLPTPLLDRLVVITMPALTRTETAVAIRHMFAELLVSNGLPAVGLPDAAVDLLADFGLRQARRALLLALGPALAAGRPAPDRDDVAAALRLLATPEPQRRVGFII